MAIGRRCAMGCETWPDQLLYTHCLHCGEETTRVSNVRPISVKDANSLLLHDQFEKFYARRCAALGIPAEDPQ